MSDLTAEQRTMLLTAIHDALLDTAISSDAVWSDATLVLDNIAPVVASLLTEARKPVRANLFALVDDWQANGNSRELGDPTAATWHVAARQLIAVLNGLEPTGW